MIGAHIAMGMTIEEGPPSVPAINGVPTSVTAFIGRALRGPINEPTRVRSFVEFERTFGPPWKDSTLGYAVSQFFDNGGTDALIVRVHNGATVATATVGGLGLGAANPGRWGQRLRVRIDHDTRPIEPTGGVGTLFTLTIRDEGAGLTEAFRDLSLEPGHPRLVTDVLARESALIRVSGAAPRTRPAASPPPPPGVADPMASDMSSTRLGADDGGDGEAITDAQISEPSLETREEGIWALQKAELVNLLCIPPLTRGAEGDIGAQTRVAAAAFCRDRRAFFIVDPLHAWSAVSDITAGAGGMDSAVWGLARTEDAALYFPRLRSPDPLQGGQLADFAPCGAVAGVIARTDAARGVWKAAAGRDASLAGVTGLAVTLTDRESERLNRLAVNCLRSFPGAGPVVWGARTLSGVDAVGSEWKYVPTRRMARFIEESLDRGTRWAALEPNGEPLWARLRASLEAFMHGLFRQGAFQGRTAREAWFVTCDATTTTRADIERGIVTMLVGFAPLKPAEFVVITIRQRCRIGQG